MSSIPPPASSFRATRARARSLEQEPTLPSAVRPEGPAATASGRSANPGTAGASRPQRVDLARPPFAVRVLNHLTFGATPESIAEFNALGANDTARLTAFVDAQLNPAAISDSALDSRLAAAGYTTLGKSLTQLWTEHFRNADFGIRILPGREAQRAALVRAMYSQRQLQEVAVDFWHNHFNVHIGNSNVAPVLPHYLRDVLRANAFGNFRTMLEAVAQSTAMLYYLNNNTNTRSGPNENFARELMELHTFGTENYLGFLTPNQVPPCPEDPSFPIGYTDLDVYDTAAAFTGWTLADGRNGTADTGVFAYVQSLHDAGPKQVLGMYLLPEQPIMKDGRDILDRLVRHPRVAKNICAKLVRRFVGDLPDQSLIDSAAQVFLTNVQSPDQLRLVLRHILLSQELRNSWGRKRRRPFESIVAALRALGSTWTLQPTSARSDDFMRRLGATGHVPYNWPAPNGFPDIAPAWSGSNGMVMTWRMLNWLTETSDDAGAPLCPVLALSRSGVASWTANNLVDFWSTRLLGRVLTGQRRQQIVGFMAQNGDPATYVIEDTDTRVSADMKRHYNQQRLRSMVSLILMSPEFMSR